MFTYLAKTENICSGREHQGCDPEHTGPEDKALPPFSESETKIQS